MFIPQEARSGPRRRHGGPRVRLAELRRSLARPAATDAVHRQRLLDLAQRAARVQALGDDYTGVGLSQYVLAALHSAAGVS